MGNFFRRVFAFLLGMVFATVLLVGGTAGYGYWAFKNLTLKDAGAEQEGIGELNNLTIEEWVALYTSAQKDPQSFTIEALERYGFSADEFIASLGVDVELVDVEDMELLREIAPLTLLEGGTDNLPMALLFAFMPKDKDGKYPFFSKRARDLLRTRPLSILSEVDLETNKPIIYKYIGDLSIGAVFSNLYEETYDPITATYTYSSTERSLSVFGNVKVAVLTDTFESEIEFDFGREVNVGKLVDIGEMKAKEFLASLLSDSEESFNEMCSSLSALQDTTVAGLYAYNEESEAYEFNLEPVLSNINIGTFMGYTLCSGNSDCPVDHKEGTSHDNNWYIENGTGVEDDLYVGEGISGDIMKNLFDLTLTRILEGVNDITFLLEGVYLGKALGYEISSKIPGSGDYCLLDCPLGQKDSSHEHKFYWVDKNNNFVGEMYNKFSNNTLTKVFTSGLDVNEIFSTTNLGGILGYIKCTGDSSTCLVEHTEEAPCGSGSWFDKNGNCIDSDDLTGKVMAKLYDKKIDDLSSLDIGELLSGNYLGDIMGYKKGTNNGYCSSDCDEHLEDNYHEHKYYWVDENDAYVGDMYNSLSNNEISKIFSDGINIDEVFSTTNLGGVLGYTKCTGDSLTCSIKHTEEAPCGSGLWFDKNGNCIDSDDLTGKVMAKLYDKKIDDLSNLDIGELLSGNYLGDMMGYEKGTNNGYCSSDCDNQEALHEHKYYWVDENGVYVGDMYNTLSNNDLSKVLSNGISIDEMFSTTNLGGVLGYTKCTGDSLTCSIKHTVEAPCGSGVWFDKNGNLVDSDDLTGKVMSKLYDKNINDLSNIDMGELLSGNYLGDMMGYEKGTNNGYCSNDCDNQEALHEHKYYWLDENKVYVGEVQNSLSNISVKSLLSGEKIVIQNVLGDSQIGTLMELKYDTQTNMWVKQDNSSVFENNNIGKILNKIYSKTIQELANGEVSDGIFEGMYFGDFLGYTYNESKAQWEKDGLFVGKIYNDISNLELEDAMTTGVDIEGVINSLKLGETLGYVYCDGESSNCQVHNSISNCDKGWYNNGVKIVEDSTMSKLMLNIYDKTLTEIKGGSLNISEITKNVYLGEFLNYKQNEFGKWVDSDNGELSKLNETLANIYISNLIDGTTDITTEIGSLDVGELMGYEYDSENGVWKDNGATISKIESILANKKLSDVLNGNLDIESEINGLELQHIISIDPTDKLLNAVKDATLETLPTKINELQIGEIVEVGDSKILSAISTATLKTLPTRINELKIGDIVEVGDDKLLIAISDATLQTLPTRINELKIGEIVEVGDSKILNAISTATLQTLPTRINELKIGEIVEIGDSKILNAIKGETLQTLPSKIDSLKIGEIVEIGDNKLLNAIKGETLQTLPSKIESLKIGDVVDTDKAGTPQVLKLLATSTLDDLGDNMNNLKIGDICGYTYDDNDELWYKDGVVVEGINQKIAKYTLEYISNNGFDSSEFTIGDVLKADLEAENSMFNLMYLGNEEGSGLEGSGDYTGRRADIPVNEIAKRMSHGFKTSTCGDMIDCGILQISDTEKLTTLFRYQDTNGDGIPEYIGEEQAEALWRSMTIKGLFDSVLAKVP